MSAALSRRSAIKVGGASLFAGLTMPEILAARRGAKSSAQAIIFLHQWGGPGQHETLDPKPDAPDTVRGWFGSRATKIPGVRVGENLPRVAAMLDKVTVIRSLAHTVPMKNHNSAGYYSLTGSPPPTDDQRLRDTIDLMPAYGSLVSKLGRANPGAPPFVALPYVIGDGSVTPGQHASFLGKSHNPLLLTENPNAPDFRLPELSLPEGVSPERLADRVAVRRLIDAQAAGLEQSAIGAGLGESFSRAVDLLTSPKFKAAFELNRESKATRERYGRTTYGQSCLLARRLVEAGARFVNVYYSDKIQGAGNGWDYHGFRGEDPKARLNDLLPVMDQTLPTLIADLEERGLLESTMVVWVGEFGRTPKISSNGGRDHWPQCYCAMVAGGGAKAGYVHGASDKLGAYPVSGQVSPEDLAATMLHALGIAPESEITDALGRPHPASRGTPIEAILA